MNMTSQCMIFSGEEQLNDDDDANEGNDADTDENGHDDNDDGDVVASVVAVAVFVRMLLTTCSQ